jgi:hypothetical protein
MGLVWILVELGWEKLELCWNVWCAEGELPIT